MAYTIYDSSGNVVMTINSNTTTGSTYPLEFIGQFYTGYGTALNTNLYRLMENFSSNAAPTNPAQGMIWHDETINSPKYYDGSQWVNFLTEKSSATSAFDMDSTSKNIALTNAGTTVLYTTPGGSTTRYMPTGLLLVPVGTPNVTSPAVINVHVNVSEDVEENKPVTMSSADDYIYFPIQGNSKSASGGQTFKLEVVTAATGTSFVVDAYLFGIIV